MEDFSDICPITHITNAQNKKYWADAWLDEALQNKDREALIKRKTRLKSKLFTNQSLANSVEIISDSQIEEGGAILISSAGTIDARISSQLRKIKEILEDALLVKEEQDFRTFQDEIDNGDED